MMKFDNVNARTQMSRKRTEHTMIDNSGFMQIRMSMKPHSLQSRSSHATRAPGESPSLFRFLNSSRPRHSPLILSNILVESCKGGAMSVSVP
jgi:hypothetical protein